MMYAIFAAVCYADVNYLEQGCFLLSIGNVWRYMLLTVEVLSCNATCVTVMWLFNWSQFQEPLEEKFPSASPHAMNFMQASVCMLFSSHLAVFDNYFLFYKSAYYICGCDFFFLFLLYKCQ